MPIIIDGYNYIGAVRDISLNEPDKEEKLINKIAYFSSGYKKKITIVFDGQKSSIYKEGAKYKRGHINIVISRYPKTADETIKIMIDTSNHKRDLTIVSSDQDIYKYAKKSGAKAINCLEFERQIRKGNINKEKELNIKMPDHEIDFWLKAFNKK